MLKTIAIPPGQEELAIALRSQGYRVQTVDQLQGPVDAILYDGGANLYENASFAYDDPTPVNDPDLNATKSAMLIDIGGRSTREIAQVLTRRLGPTNET